MPSGPEEIPECEEPKFKFRTQRTRNSCIYIKKPNEDNKMKINQTSLVPVLKEAVAVNNRYENVPSKPELPNTKKALISPLIGRKKEFNITSKR